MFSSHPCLGPHSCWDGACYFPAAEEGEITSFWSLGEPLQHSWNPEFFGESTSHRHFGEMACSFVLTLKNKMQREKTEGILALLLWQPHMPSATVHASVELPVVVFDSTCLVLPWVLSIGDRPAGLSGHAYLDVYLFFHFLYLHWGKWQEGSHPHRSVPVFLIPLMLLSEQWSWHSWPSLWHQSASWGKKCIIE